MFGVSSMTPGNVSLAVDGAVFLIVFFGGLLISWWALGALQWDKFVHLPLGPQANMLRFLLALLGGTLWGIIAILYLFAIELIRML